MDKIFDKTKFSFEKKISLSQFLSTSSSINGRVFFLFYFWLSSIISFFLFFFFSPETFFCTFKKFFRESESRKWKFSHSASQPGTNCGKILSPAALFSSQNWLKSSKELLRQTKTSLRSSKGSIKVCKQELEGRETKQQHLSQNFKHVRDRYRF